MKKQKQTTQNNLFTRKLFLLALLVSTLYSDAHIFVYHRFGDAKHASTNTSIDVLKKQFDYFKDNKYEVISLEKLSKALFTKKEIPDNWVVLCIDDSYKSFYQNGLEVFKQYNYPFALFVYVEATQKHYGDFMSWKQIQESSKYGDIALHSYAHDHLVSKTLLHVREDTKKSYDIFTQQMGFSPKYYAYPYGEYTNSIKEELKKFNFDLIFNQNAGAVNKESDRFDLDRIALTGDVNLKSKFRIKTLHVKWIEPTRSPKDGKLNTIRAKISPTLKSVEYYVSGYGWKRAKLNDGELLVHPNVKLIFTRTRIFIKSNNRQSSIILVKE